MGVLTAVTCLICNMFRVAIRREEELQHRIARVAEGAHVRR
jgi:hypothetical protein